MPSDNTCPPPPTSPNRNGGAKPPRKPLAPAGFPNDPDRPDREPFRVIGSRSCQSLATGRFMVVDAAYKPPRPEWDDRHRRWDSQGRFPWSY